MWTDWGSEAPQVDRLTERSPGPPPWAPRPGLTLAGKGLLVLLAAAAVSTAASLVWRIVDYAADLR